MSVYDRTRPNDTVRDLYTTLFEFHSTSEPNSVRMVYKSYEIVRDRPNTRMSHDHGTVHTSAHTVTYDRHTTNTVKLRIIYRPW
jgi:hypothetical protein